MFVILYINKHTIKEYVGTESKVTPAFTQCEENSKDKYKHMLASSRCMPGFLKSLLYRYLDICVCVCVCVHPQAINYYSRKMKPD